MLKNFKVNVAFRQISLVVVMLAFFYCLYYTNFYVTTFILLVIAAILFWDTVNYMDKTNEDFTAFLMGIQYEDFSATYSGYHKGSSFGKLYEAFNLITTKFRNIKAEKVANHQYLQTIIENVNTGLLCINGEGDVVLMNKALKELLRKPYLKDIAAVEKLFPEIHELIERLETGQNEMVKMTVQNKLLELSVTVADFKLREVPYKLVSFQNIQKELEEKELDAWQKLIRILTHEIMNSVTPITSLASSINSILADKDKELDEEEMEDIRDGMYAIQKRGEGLLHFTETYRSLTKIPPPKFQLVEAQPLLDRIHILFKPVLKKYGVELNLKLPSSMVVFIADVELIEQVVINLLKNAIEAAREVENPKIEIRAIKTNEGKTFIEVQDNGKGIKKDVLDKIFVPFFTTKKEGSGIGLSLSRQIMRLHKGNIEVNSVVGEGTVFTLSL